jgi:molybdopterin-guanine dinucleotide biosynthesis protein A
MPPVVLELANVALAVLAGGDGRRMGFPKAEIRLGGRPILHVLLEQFAWPGPTLLVTAAGREHPTGADAFDREVADPVAGQGPLRGVLTSLENTPVPVVLVTAVDMPFVRHEHLRWLAAAIRGRADTAGLVTRRGGEVEPLPAALTTVAIPHVRRWLETGRRSLRGLFEDPAFVTLDAPADWPDVTWTNLNSPGDLPPAGG